MKQWTLWQTSILANILYKVILNKLTQQIIWKKMIKIFGSKDSLFYADNNSSWANDLALELGYVLFLWIKVYGTDDFGFLLDMFSIGMSVLIILLAFW